jgi:hypothetical protein
MVHSSSNSSHRKSNTKFNRRQKFLKKLRKGKILPLAQVGKLALDETEWLIEWALNSDDPVTNQSACHALAAAAFPQNLILGFYLLFSFFFFVADV